MEVIEELLAISYVQALGVALLSVVAAFLVEQIIARTIAVAASRTKTDLDDAIVEIIRRPIFISVLLYGLSWSEDLLELPDGFEGPVEALLQTIAIIIWTVAVMRVGGLLLETGSAKARDRSMLQPRTLPVFDILLKTFAIAACCYFVFLAWNVDLTGWLASAGIVGIAVGFAAKDTLANLFAVPVVSLFVVPVLLVAVLLHGALPALAVPLLQLAALALSWLWRLLEAIAAWPFAQAWLPEPSLAAVLLAIIGAVLVLLPRVVPGRALGALLFLPLLAPAREAPVDGEFDVVVLDVGQGLSVLVRTRAHALLYDAGAAPPGGLDQGDAAVVPALRALGVRRLDALVVSHGDNDHAGGAPSVIAALRPHRTLHGPGFAVGRACTGGTTWDWDGVRFELVHPPPHFPDLGNDSSCVLRVSSGAASALLPGDLSAAMEQRLVREQRIEPATLLLIPHHGSAGSSSAELLDAVRPRLAVASAGYRSRFGHPAAAAVARYRERGIALFATPASGALAIRLAPDGTFARIAARRAEVRRYWHEPAANGLPDVSHAAEGP